MYELTLPSDTSVLQNIWRKPNFKIYSQSDSSESSILGLNAEKLMSYSSLEKGWNGYDAEPIPASVIDKTRNFLMQLPFQPNIVPTGRQTIQIDYDLDKDDFIEIEIFENSILMYYELKGKVFEAEVSEKDAVNKLKEFMVWKEKA